MSHISGILKMCAGYFKLWHNSSMFETKIKLRNSRLCCCIIKYRYANKLENPLVELLHNARGEILICYAITFST